MNNFAFIDSQNVNLGIRSRKWNLDWGKFRLLLKNKYFVTKAFLFIGYIEENKELYTSLEKAGYTLIYKNVLTVTRNGKSLTKGNVDAELVLNTMLQIDNFEKAIIATGDGDFFCLIEYLEKEGKLLKIFTPTGKYSSLIRKFSKYTVDMSMLREKLEYKNKSKKEKERHSRGKQG